MRTFAAMLEWHDGQFTLPASISAEYGKPLPNGTRQRVGTDPSSQWACMHMLRALIDGSRQLGEEPEPAWLTLRDALPPWTLIGAPGDERIAVWRDADLDISHRHHSYLSCIYPFDSLGPRTPQMQAIVHRSLRRWLEVGVSDWSEWALPWAAIIEAREGYRDGPHLLLKLCRDLFVNEGMATVYIPRVEGFTLHGFNWRTGPLESCEIMQLDGTMAMATGLYEMLVHRHGDEVRFFPAVPAAWRNVSFNDIRLPGPIRASGDIVDGKVQRISLTSQCHQTVRVVVPGYDSMQLERDGRDEQVTLPMQLTLRPGQHVEGCPTRSVRISAPRANRGRNPPKMRAATIRNSKSR